METVEFPPHRIETLESIAKTFRTVNYVRETTPNTKFGDNLFRGTSGQMDEM